MATDATGAVTSPDNIPTYNTAADAPSGKGLNAIVAAIQAALSALRPSSLIGYPADATKALFGDGTWKVPVAGTMVQLFDSTLGAPAANFDITGISAAYTHLMLVLEGRMSGAVTLGSVTFTLNGDTGANYDWYGNKTSNTGGNVANGVGGGASAAISDGFFAGASAAAGAFSGADMMIRNYAGTTLRKSYNARAAGQDATAVLGSWVGGGGWVSTAAINRITLTPSSGNFITGTRCTLYGIL